MADTAVDRLATEFAQIGQVLSTSGEISLKVTADDIFRKVLLLSAASLFEKELTQCIANICAELSDNSDIVCEFLRNKAMARQYHTYFQWDSKNANSFYALFGQGFGDFMKAYVKANSEYEASVKAFLEVGRERNRITHEDLASAPLEKTAEEILLLYIIARLFVDSLPLRFHEYLATTH